MLTKAVLYSNRIDRDKTDVEQLLIAISSSYTIHSLNKTYCAN